MGSHVTSAAEKIAIVVGMLLYVGAVIFLGSLTDTSLFKVFMGLLPTLLYLMAFFLLFQLDASTVALWLLPLVFPALFIILWFTDASDAISSMDGPVIAVINILLSYFINIFLLLILSTGTVRHTVKVEHHHKVDNQELGLMKRELDSVKSKLQDAESQLYDRESLLKHKESQLMHKDSELHHKDSQLHSTVNELEDTRLKLLESQKATLDAKHELIVSKENFNITLRSIEDKCKAINFVIGRVYSDRKGASDAERSKLRIDSLLYNSFSELTADFKDEDAEKLYYVLRRIYKQLLYLELPEKDVVKLHNAALPVARNKHGTDRVIDVLQNNDKDPVMDYHSGAKEICEKLMRFLKKNYLDSGNKD